MISHTVSISQPNSTFLNKAQSTVDFFQCRFRFVLFEDVLENITCRRTSHNIERHTIIINFNTVYKVVPICSLAACIIMCVCARVLVLLTMSFYVCHNVQ